MTDDDEFYNLVGSKTTINPDGDALITYYCADDEDEDPCDRSTTTPVEDGWLGVPDLDGIIGWFCPDCRKEVEKIAAILDERFPDYDFIRLLGVGQSHHHPT
jgi:hypothetical protein